MGLACGSRSLLSRRDRDYWFLAVGRLCSLVPGSVRPPRRRPPHAFPRGFILPRPASSSEFLRSSSRPSCLGLYLIRVFKPSSRPTEGVHYRESIRPSLRSVLRFSENLPTVSSAFGVAGLFRPAATSRVLSARSGRRFSQPLDAIVALHQACHAGAKCAARPNISSAVRKIREETSHQRARPDGRSREALAWARRTPAQHLRASLAARARRG